ncbi:hypothetical protein I310_03621 [Cryptococcus deuterogattii CA1014]|nr:hypothetical protein I352_06210 [Cryptococcus deuterogattii MMRL2647]KIR73013.1 hypothetical protein I310_03621 [Cryptococcus deuterogattii CA1014]KIS00671.1 hypothetical protein L804_02091 [Cryptococcus deuterogattii 2001/935-1]
MRGEEDSKGEHCVAADGYALILRTSTSPSSCSWWVQWAVRLGDERTAEASGREVTTTHNRAQNRHVGTHRALCQCHADAMPIPRDRHAIVTRHHYLSLDHGGHSAPSIKSELMCNCQSSHAMAVPRIAHLSHKSVLELSGPDAQKFLKGLSCKDVEYLGGGYSGFLNASGRVLHTAFIFPRSKNSYLITHESPEDHPAPLTSLLPPFKLRSKVRIKDVTNQWDAWSAWGSDLQGGPHPIRTWKMGSGGASESHWDWEGGIRDLGLRDDEAGCWDLRAGWPRMGRQLLVPKGEKRVNTEGGSASLATSHDLGNVHDYELHRMLLGVPEGPKEILPGQALPLESCMDIHGGV